MITLAYPIRFYLKFYLLHPTFSSRPYIISNIPNFFRRLERLLWKTDRSHFSAFRATLTHSQLGGPSNPQNTHVTVEEQKTNERTMAATEYCEVMFEKLCAASLYNCDATTSERFSVLVLGHPHRPSFVAVGRKREREKRSGKLQERVFTSR